MILCAKIMGRETDRVGVFRGSASDSTHPDYCAEAKDGNNYCITSGEYSGRYKC